MKIENVQELLETIEAVSYEKIVKETNKELASGISTDIKNKIAYIMLDEETQKQDTRVVHPKLTKWVFGLGGVIYFIQILGVLFGYMSATKSVMIIDSLALMMVCLFAASCTLTINGGKRK